MTAKSETKTPLKCPKCDEVLQDYDLGCGFGRCKICGGVDLRAPIVKGGARQDVQVAATA